MKLAKRGARIFEVPIKYSGRTYQEGKKIGWKDGLHALGCIIKFAASDQVYTADQYGSEILARLNRAPKFTRWMADSIHPYIGSKVLELGAGIGNMTLNLAPRQVYWASDVNPLYLGHLEKLRETRPYLRVCRTDASSVASYPRTSSSTPLSVSTSSNIWRTTSVPCAISTTPYRSMAGGSSWFPTRRACTPL